MNTIYGGLKQLHVPQIGDDAKNVIKLEIILLCFILLRGSIVFSM